MTAPVSSLLRISFNHTHREKFGYNKDLGYLVEKNFDLNQTEYVALKFLMISKKFDEVPTILLVLQISDFWDVQRIFHNFGILD